MSEPVRYRGFVDYLPRSSYGFLVCPQTKTRVFFARGNMRWAEQFDDLARGDKLEFCLVRDDARGDRAEDVVLVARAEPVRGRGRVFRVIRDYGFLRSPLHHNVFFSFCECNGVELNEGDDVTFTLLPGMPHPRAVDIVRVPRTS